MSSVAAPAKPREWHLIEYALEAWALGLFMVSASGFAIVLFHPDSPALRILPNEMARRVLMGVAMGLTLILNVYSPWGKRSGAHTNPAVTLTFLRLGKIAPQDAIGYIGAQFMGAVLGTAFAALAFAPWIRDPAVNYVITVPGPWGPSVAFTAEILISFALMLAVLLVSDYPPLARWTGLAAGFIVALYITFESPVSGMSMNPARTFGSALPAGVWTGWWIYFLAPPAGMLLAAEVYRGWRGRRAACAKLYHVPGVRCIFCEHQQA